MCIKLWSFNEEKIAPTWLCSECVSAVGTGHRWNVLPARTRSPSCHTQPPALHLRRWHTQNTTKMCTACLRTCQNLSSKVKSMQISRRKNYAHTFCECTCKLQWWVSFSSLLCVHHNTVRSVPTVLRPSPSRLEPLLAEIPLAETKKVCRRRTDDRWSTNTKQQLCDLDLELHSATADEFLTVK